MSRRSSTVYSIALVLVLLVAVPAVGWPSYLHRDKAWRAAKPEALVFAADVGASSWWIVPSYDCRHHGRLVVSCGFGYQVRDVHCTSTMWVRFTRFGLVVLPRGGRCV